MAWRTFLVAAIVVVNAGCGLSATTPVSRTVTGIGQTQVLIAAQHRLAEDGLDFEKIDFENHVITTAWDKENRKMIQYEVTVAPMAPSGGSDQGNGQTEGAPSTVTVTVSAKARHRVVGGWTDPEPTGFAGADRLLDKIVSLAIGRYNPNVVPVVVAPGPLVAPAIEDPAPALEDPDPEVDPDEEDRPSRTGAKKRTRRQGHE